MNELVKRTGCLIVILLLVLFFSFRQVKGQDEAEQAKNAIANIDDQIRSGIEDLHYYWNNITDSTRFDALSDIQKAWQYYSYAKGLYNIGLYNESLQDAYTAMLTSHRATYRIFLDIAHTHLMRANSTITNIPNYIPQPTEAVKKLQQASELYNDAYLSMIFGDGAPPVETAKEWINGMYYAEKKLYWASDANVVKIADEASSDAASWARSQEASKQQEIKEQINGISNTFYYHLVIPFAANLISSLGFLAPITLRIKGWLRKKTNHKIIWNGDLSNRKLNWTLIIAAITAMAVFAGILHTWTDSVYGLARTYSYSVSIPTDLLRVIDVLLWLVAFSIVALIILFITNRFKWQKATGLLFIALLVLGMVLCIGLIVFGLMSIGQINYSATL